MVDALLPAGFDPKTHVKHAVNTEAVRSHVQRLQAVLLEKDVGNKGSGLACEQAILIGTHQHYKGGIYQVLFECPHSETGEMLVVRKHLWPYDFSIMAVPKEVFLQDIALGVPRYRVITAAEKDHAEAQLKKKYA
jgi:hypothetical protein